MFVQRAIVIILVVSVKICSTQVLLFGKCVEVETMKYFNIDNFLGKWYEIQRYPAWYEKHGHCPYKRIQACGRRIEVEHGYVKDGIQFILHVNSTYAPGDEAVLNFEENNIDPVGIPMTVISTDYTNYALVYGCKYKENVDLKYFAAWILSREPTLSDELLQKTRDELNSIPYASVAYLETVGHEKCDFHWTAHVHAVNVSGEDESRKNGE
ncbi:lopap-like [Epargyreus clarus]|uniref:lopap-like n=1 Tax=Epargyreus clarus TaxID=520877 RepID=UPI003C2C4FEC